MGTCSCKMHTGFHASSPPSTNIAMLRAPLTISLIYRVQDLPF